MALPLANSFDGGSAGTAVSTVNSGGASGDAFDAVTPGASETITYDATNPAHGSGLGGAFTTAATVVASYVNWTTSLGTLSTGQRIAGRVYFLTPSATHTSSLRFVTIWNGATVLCGIVQNSGSTGDLGLRGSGDTAVGTLSGTGLTLNTLWRVEFDFQGIGSGATGGTGTARLFAGDSTTATGGDASATGVNFGSLAPDQIRFGVGTANATASITYYLDGMQVNSTGLPGPESTVSIPAGVTDMDKNRFPKPVLRSA